MKPLREQRGVALLLVLWLIAMLTALIGGFALAARIEHLQGRVLVGGVVAGNAARAGVEYALLRVSAPEPRQQWLPDGRKHQWRYREATVEVTLVDENGKVDLNQADAQLLTELIRRVSRGMSVDGENEDSDNEASETGELPQTEAAKLAAAVIDWRDPDLLTQPAGGAEDGDYEAAGRDYGAKDAQFESTAELEQVLGFTPALYAKLEPHLTVFSGRTRPDPAFASSEVLDAMGMDGTALVTQRHQWKPGSGLPPPSLPDGGSLVGGNSGTYSIDSHARLADGRESILRVVVRAGGGAISGMAYTPLRWEEGASPR